MCHFITRWVFLLLQILPICYVAFIGLPLVGCRLHGTEHLAARKLIYILKSKF